MANSDVCPKEQALGGLIFLPFRARSRAGAHPTRTESQLDTDQTTHTIQWLEEPNFPGELTVPLVHVLWSGSRGRLKGADKAILPGAVHKPSNEPIHIWLPPFLHSPLLPAACLGCLCRFCKVTRKQNRVLLSSSALGYTSSREEQGFVLSSSGSAYSIPRAPCSRNTFVADELSLFKCSQRDCSQSRSSDRLGAFKHHGKHTGYATLS